MMSIEEILEQARALAPHERKELAKLLIDMLDAPTQAHPPRTGAELVAMLGALVDGGDAGSHQQSRTGAG